MGEPYQDMDPWYVPRSDLSYRVNGFTAEHLAALEKALKSHPDLKVTLKDGRLEVSREGVGSADEYQAFRREVDLAIRRIAPKAEVTNVYPGQPGS